MKYSTHRAKERQLLAHTSAGRGDNRLAVVREVVLLEVVKLPHRKRVRDLVRARVSLLEADFSRTHGDRGNQVLVGGHSARLGNGERGRCGRLG